MLLILRDLDDATTARLLSYAEALGLDALVEAHDDRGAATRRLPPRADHRRECPRPRHFQPRPRVTQLDLVARAPRDLLVIAESAVHTRAQAAAAELAGADAVLVGTALMKAPIPARSSATCFTRW